MESAVQLTNEKLTDSQKKAIQKTFALIDLNHDKRISANELRRSLKVLGLRLTPEETEELIKDADKNSNGLIEYDEFEKLIGHQFVITNYKNKQLKEAFKRFDKNGDGFIEAHELKEVFAESGEQIDDAQVQELMSEADTNKDGVISFDEFVHAVCEKDW